MKIQILIRLPKENKHYIKDQLQKFAEKLDSNKIEEVQFGKQDMRGTESITLIDHKGCVPCQIHFRDKWQMLGYVMGYNEAHEKDFSSIGRFIK